MTTISKDSRIAHSTPRTIFQDGKVITVSVKFSPAPGKSPFLVTGISSQVVIATLPTIPHLDTMPAWARDDMSSAAWAIQDDSGQWLTVSAPETLASVEVVS